MERRDICLEIKYKTETRAAITWLLDEWIAEIGGDLNSVQGRQTSFFDQEPANPNFVRATSGVNPFSKLRMSPTFQLQEFQKILQAKTPEFPTLLQAVRLSYTSRDISIHPKIKEMFPNLAKSKYVEFAPASSEQPQTSPVIGHVVLRRGQASAYVSKLQMKQETAQESDKDVP